MDALRNLVEKLMGEAMAAASPLTGGDISEVIKITLESGQEIVVKRSRPESASTTRTEARMLNYLAKESELPVPQVLHVDDQNLILEFIEGQGRIDAEVEQNAAHHLAGLHGVTADSFGFDEDTVIGSLSQPNQQSRSWVEFFRDQRLMYMAGLALQSGQLDKKTFGLIESFAAKLDDYLDEPVAPSLLHGDLWGGNIIAHQGKVAAFIDPAIYFGHPEMDLAFSTLFGSFGDSFFERYMEQRQIMPGFFELRKDIYNLWPLLVHVRLFGGSYLAQLQSILGRFVY